MTAPKLAATNPYVVNHLRQLIYYHLDCNLLRNALFFAGRLHAYEPRSSEAAYLLALCHLRMGQVKAAYDYTWNAARRGTHLGCAYVFAQACLILEKYGEGANALDLCRGMWSGKSNWGRHSDARRQHLPDAAAVWCLKGKLCQAHSQHNKAIECYEQALKSNPFMWDAFTGLCDLGVKVRMPNIFRTTPEMMIALEGDPLAGSTEDPLQSGSAGNVLNHASSANDPFSISKNRVNGDVRHNGGASALFEKLSSAKNIVTPILNGRPTQTEDTPASHGGIMDPEFFSAKGAGDNDKMTSQIDPLLAPVKKTRAPAISIMDTYNEAPPRMNTTTGAASRLKSRTDSDDHDGRSSSSTGGAELKRTVSGKPAATSIAARLESGAGSGDLGPPQRKSVRLLNQLRPQSGRSGLVGGSIGSREGRELRKAKAPGAKVRSTNTLNAGRQPSGHRKNADSMDIDSKEQRPPPSHNPPSSLAISTKPTVNERAKELESLQTLLDLCTKIGTGYFALSHYQCQEALRCFNAIPAAQRDTPWVLAQIGRAHFEQTFYSDAEKAFARLRTLCPSRLEDMEVYSTTLWHLKNDVDLAFLAHEMVDLDRNSPQAWCAVGNSFSLQRDHDQALKCFKRAIQLDPNFAYAYTLQGHEHVSNEEYDKAMQAFRAAISADKRHYNAWYGLGRVFEKQGKYQVAEQHYRTAHSINPTNAVLITFIGNVLEKMKNPRAALVQFSKACDLDEKSALCRYRKARVLMTLGEAERSLVELKVLKDIAPDEANVHFLLGRVYKALRQKGNAIRHFTMALNLDPKASHYIKEAMEQMEDEDDDDDDDASM